VSGVAQELVEELGPPGRNRKATVSRPWAPSPKRSDFERGMAVRGAILSGTSTAVVTTTASGSYSGVSAVCLGACARTFARFGTGQEAAEPENDASSGPGPRQAAQHRDREQQNERDGEESPDEFGARERPHGAEDRRTSGPESSPAAFLQCSIMHVM
jgi:hypothetical protein